MKVEWKGGFEADSDDAILVSGLLHGSSTGRRWLMWSELKWDRWRKSMNNQKSGHDEKLFLNPSPEVPNQPSVRYDKHANSLSVWSL